MCFAFQPAVPGTVIHISRIIAWYQDKINLFIIPSGIHMKSVAFILSACSVNSNLMMETSPYHKMFTCGKDANGVY